MADKQPERNSKLPITRQQHHEIIHEQLAVQLEESRNDYSIFYLRVKAVVYSQGLNEMADVAGEERDRECRERRKTL